MNVEIANRLVELRKRKGLSQEALASELGISRQAVSKWERAESSPDTDNLILLAKLYGMSLDELLNIDALGSDDQTAYNDNDQASEKGKKRKSKKDYVHIGLDGIHVLDGDEEVHIDFSGIHVNSDSKVDISDEGVFINGKRVDDKKWWQYSSDEYYDQANDKWMPKKKKRVILDYFPYALFALVVFCYFGFIQGIWSPSWLILLTIPIYDSLANAIRKRKPKVFNYPLLVIVTYFYIGLTQSVWSPTWVIFLTIPAFYYIIDFFKNLSKND